MSGEDVGIVVGLLLMLGSVVTILALIYITAGVLLLIFALAALAFAIGLGILSS